MNKKDKEHEQRFYESKRAEEKELVEASLAEFSLWREQYREK